MLCDLTGRPLPGRCGLFGSVYNGPVVATERVQIALSIRRGPMIGAAKLPDGSGGILPREIRSQDASRTGTQGRLPRILSVDGSNVGSNDCECFLRFAACVKRRQRFQGQGQSSRPREATTTIPVGEWPRYPLRFLPMLVSTLDVPDRD